jgi:predicted HicB family RNase H-like nuclease
MTHNSRREGQARPGAPAKYTSHPARLDLRITEELAERLAAESDRRRISRTAIVVELLERNLPEVD